MRLCVWLGLALVTWLYSTKANTEPGCEGVSGTPASADFLYGSCYFIPDLVPRTQADSRTECKAMDPAADLVMLPDYGVAQKLAYAPNLNALGTMQMWTGAFGTAIPGAGRCYDYVWQHNDVIIPISADDYAAKMVTDPTKDANVYTFTLLGLGRLKDETGVSKLTLCQTRSATKMMSFDVHEGMKGVGENATFGSPIYARSSTQCGVACMRVVACLAGTGSLLFRQALADERANKYSSFEAATQTCQLHFTTKDDPKLVLEAAGAQDVFLDSI